MELNVNWVTTYNLTMPKKKILIIKPDIWIAFGESQGSKQFEIELKANPRNFTAPEEVREKYPKRDKKVNNGRLCKDLARHLSSKGYPTVTSRRAGGYICEQMLYTLLDLRNKNDKLSIFIHVPTELEPDKLKNFGLAVFDYVSNCIYKRYYTK